MVSPRRLPRARLPPPRTDPPSDVYMRVSRGRAFPASDTGIRHGQEVRHMKRQMAHYRERIRLLTGANIPGVANTIHMFQQRLAGAGYRIQQLEQARIHYVHQGQYHYPNPNPNQAYLWA